MRKKLIGFYLALLLLAAAQLACGKFEVILVTPTPKGYTIPSSPTPSQDLDTSTATATPNTGTITPVASPTPEASTKPSFSEQVRFYFEPDPEKSQRVFPPGTRQVFAIWDYANMRAGMIIRREWFKDSKLWLVREEPWDFARYGSNGTIADVTLFDFITGLEPGAFWLRLYIDDVPQFQLDQPDQASFRLLPGNGLASVASPDGNHLAVIPDPRTLAIREPDGTQRILVITTEISSLAWFPSSKYIVYSVRDRTKETINDPSTGYRDELWLVDITSGLRIRLSTPEENLSFPVVSPDSRYIATLTGYDEANTCSSSLSIAFIEVDDQLSRVAIHHINEFSGLPPVTQSPVPLLKSGSSQPGVWKTKNQFEIPLVWPCSNGSMDGTYTFNVENFQVAKAP